MTDQLTTLRAALSALEEAQKASHNIGMYLHGVPQSIEPIRTLISSMESQEPFGTVVQHRHNFDFYRWGDSPYLDNAKAHWLVYTHPAQPAMEAQPTASVDAVEWAVGKWIAEVENRPLVNVHRRSLDDTWRTVIRHFGGDDSKLLPLKKHDDLVMNDRQNSRASGTYHAQPSSEQITCDCGRTHKRTAYGWASNEPKVEPHPTADAAFEASVRCGFSKPEEWPSFELGYTQGRFDEEMHQGPPEEAFAQPKAEPVQEPVAWMKRTNAGGDWDTYDFSANQHGDFQTPLYAAPQARKPLSDQEMWALWNSQGNDEMNQQEAIAFAREIERRIIGDAND